MIGQEIVAPQRSAFRQDILGAAAAIASRGGYGTLVLDSLGKILSCGEPAERMFGTSRGRLVGRGISEFIAGLFLDGSSPSYRARYLGYLCANGEWREFEAADADGHEFAVQLNLARMVTDGREIFVLTVRRPENLADS